MVRHCDILTGNSKLILGTLDILKVYNDESYQALVRVCARVRSAHTTPKGDIDPKANLIGTLFQWQG